jgi:hypothetical protein
MTGFERNFILPNLQLIHIATSECVLAGGLV